MNTFKHRQCYEIISSLDDIHPFKVLDNVNASDMNIITSYNTCSRAALFCNRCTLDKLYLEVNPHIVIA